jgi:hypothetical protein
VIHDSFRAISPRASCPQGKMSQDMNSPESEQERIYAAKYGAYVPIFPVRALRNRDKNPNAPTVEKLNE